MSIQIWLAFVAASAVVLIIPGPTILAVISYSVAHGRRANVLLVAGVAAGDATALIVSLVGLGTLLSTSAFWFTVVKTAGGLYLLYLGVNLLRAGKLSTELAPPATLHSPWKLFANTYVVTALNPKSTVFFVAFLPQFVDHDARVTEQLFILASTFVCMAAVNATLYAWFAMSARSVLASARAQRRFNIVGGSLLSAAGVWGLLAKRSG
jgi:threonine/homoserine/homoserine lactone efflux protein